MYESVRAVCPYYRRHSAKNIKCEGIGNGICFDGKEAATQHIREVCGDIFAWEKCPVAMQLNAKYSG